MHHKLWLSALPKIIFLCFCVNASSPERNFRKTFPKTNLAPENRWLEDDPFILGWPCFQGRTGSFRECNISLAGKSHEQIALYTYIIIWNAPRTKIDVRSKRVAIKVYFGCSPVLQGKQWRFMSALLSKRLKMNKIFNLTGLLQGFLTSASMWFNLLTCQTVKPYSHPLFEGDEVTSRRLVITRSICFTHARLMSDYWKVGGQHLM